MLDQIADNKCCILLCSGSINKKYNSMPDQTIHGKTFVKTVLLDEQITFEPTIGSLQADFPLCEADFMRIKSGKPTTLNWAHSIFLTTIGIVLLIFGKYLSTKWGYQAKILLGEWIACGAGILLSLILYLVGIALPHERKKVMKSIEEHFRKAPRTRHLMGKDNDI